MKSADKNSPVGDNAPASSTPEEQPVTTAPISTKKGTVSGPIDTVARWHDYHIPWWDPGGPPDEPDWWPRDGSTKPKHQPFIKSEHLRFISEHSDSGSISYLETRGLLKSETLFPLSDLDLITDRGTEDALEYASLCETAASWLREAGETERDTVSEGAQHTEEPAGTGEPDPRDALERWWFQIGTKHGFLSPIAIAAKFVAASHWVHRLSEGNEQLRGAIYSLVKAAYRMQFEASGHHARAVRNVAGRAKGPAAKKDKANRKEKIIRDHFDAWANDANERDRQNPKKAAHELLEAINTDLTKSGLRKYKDDKPLIKKLRQLISERSKAM